MAPARAEDGVMLLFCGFPFQHAKGFCRSYHLKLDITSTAASSKPVTKSAAAIASAQDSLQGFPVAMAHGHTARHFMQLL